MRTDRSSDSIRKISITRNYIIYPEGSVLIEIGNTKVICNATVEENVPNFLKNSGKGWLTAEYSMLPCATHKRNRRDISSLKLNSRAVEIQRLIGRSLRSALDLEMLGERTINIDCDVIQADGGTRCASITGGFIALHDAISKLSRNGLITKNPIKNFVAAVSAGIVDGEICLDLAYEEDSKAEVDMNFVMNDKLDFIEIQGTAENGAFSRETMNEMMDLASEGISKIINIQKNSIGDNF